MRASGGIVCSGIIDGQDGKGITSADVMFCIISGTGTPADTANWQTTVAQLNLSDSTKEYYLWQATYITYTDNTHVYTGKVCLGQVKDFASVKEQYARGTASAADSATWQNDTPPAPQKGSYLWTRTKLEFTNGNISFLPSEAGYCLGYYGEDGKGITSADVMFCIISGTGTPADTANWQTTVAQLNLSDSTKEYYLWQATYITYTDNTHAYTGKVCLGQVKDFASVTEQYARGTASAADSNTWQNDTPPAPQKGSYLWTRTKLVFANGNISFLPSEAGYCLGYYGEDGKGITSADVMFCIISGTGTPADTANWQTTVAQLNLSDSTKEYYLWQATYITYTDNTHAYTGKVCLGQVKDFASVTEQYARGTASAADSNTWQNDTPPAPQKGSYLWMRTKLVFANGNISFLPSEAGYCLGYYGEDGISAPYVELSRTAILYHANDQGQSVAAQSFEVDCYLKVNGKTCNISSVDDISVGTISGVAVTKNSTSRITLQVTHSQVIQGIVSVEMTGSYGGKTYTAKTSITVEPNRDGQEGPPGENAPYNVYTYGRSKTRTDYSGTNFDGQTGWVSVAPAPNDTYPYIWQRIQSYSGDDELQDTSYICLTGAVGGVGATGKMCYIAGEYDPAKTYTSNSQQTVAVEVPIDGSSDVELYYLAAATNVVNGEHIAPTDAGQTVWQKGLNNYNLIRTKYLFADFAHLGSAIITGDWLISACGTIGGTAYNTTDINHPVTYTHNGEEKAAYMWFDPVHPNDDVTHNFIPNFAVDLLTGRSYQNEAYIKGEVHATSGDFENVKISGGIRSPFTFIDPNGTFSTDLSEHMSILTSSGDTLFNLPWDVSQSGRRITIVNYMWDSLFYTSGWAKINVPSNNQFFFEDGAQKTSLIVATKEVVELLGYGSPTHFEGWIVMNRLNISSGKDYGHPQLVLAKGVVTGGSSPKVIGVAYTGAQVYVSHISLGRYQLYTNPSVFRHTSDELMALATGMGFVNSKPVSANVSVVGNSIEVYTFTSDGLVDGNFSFMIMNADDISHLGF